MILDMYINEPAENWGQILAKADFPLIKTGMCAFVTTVMTLFLPHETAAKVVGLALFIFQGYISNFIVTFLIILSVSSKKIFMWVLLCLFWQSFRRTLDSLFIMSFLASLFCFILPVS